MSLLLNIYCLFSIDSKVIRNSRSIVVGILMLQLVIIALLKFMILKMNEKQDSTDSKIFPINNVQTQPQGTLISNKQKNNHCQQIRANIKFKPHPLQTCLEQNKYSQPTLKLMPCYSRKNKRLVQTNVISQYQNKKKKQFQVIFELPHDHSQISSSSPQHQGSGLTVEASQAEKGQNQVQLRNEFLKIDISNQDFHTISNLLVGHSFIAFSLGILYFPFLILPIFGGFHLLMIISLGLAQILIKQDLKKKLVQRLLIGGVFCVNLLIIGCGLLGIIKASNPYY